MTDLMIDPLACKYLEEPDANEHITEMRNREADALLKFAQLYPVPVIRALRENLLNHIVKVLENAGMESTARLIGHELFAIDDYLQSMVVASFTHDRARKMAQCYGADDLQATVAQVIRFMQEDGALEVN